MGHYPGLKYALLSPRNVFGSLPTRGLPMAYNFQKSQWYWEGRKGRQKSPAKQPSYATVFHVFQASGIMGVTLYRSLCGWVGRKPGLNLARYLFDYQNSVVTWHQKAKAPQGQYSLSWASLIPIKYLVELPETAQSLQKRISCMRPTENSAVWATGLTPEGVDASGLSSFLRHRATVGDFLSGLGGVEQ